VAILRVLTVAVIATSIDACAIQRAQVASDAQSQMIGMNKEQILACMGPPASRATEGATEVWSYPSGNSQTTVSTFGTGGPGYTSAFGVATQRFCTVNVTMTSGRVSRMNYVGPTGGLLTPGEQCAFALQSCAQAR
jgi:outer membrane protein assembly factor BamE (lipoprotein component of BamABCDE complex)